MGDEGSRRYLKLVRRELRALRELMSAVVSVEGEGVGEDNDEEDGEEVEDEAAPAVPLEGDIVRLVWLCRW